jgi:threonine/homoserine/homoserine lactone efflux protein
MQFPLLSGLALGLSIAAPVGPVALLCLRRSVADGLAVGLVSGLGAATADAIGGAVAAFGMPALLGAVERHHTALQAGGGVFMLALGIFILRFPPKTLSATAPAPLRAGGWVAAYGSALLLTIANPMTVLSFAAAVATLGPAMLGATRWSSSVFVLGVFAGSALWWLVWCGAAEKFRRQLEGGAMCWVNALAGGGLAVFGAVQLARLGF